MLNVVRNVEYLKAARIGFEFEFFAEGDKNDVAKSLATELGKKVILPTSITELNVEEYAYHSSFTPTSKIFKLEPDFSGGPAMLELITGPLDYYEARQILIKVCNWIDENGYTSEKTGIHLNISFDESKVDLKNKISNVHPLKFCLEFDESQIFSRFPNRKNNVYAKSVKNIYPTFPFMFIDDITTIFQENYTTPTTKYFGINFLKQVKDYFEIRYLGGKDYHKKAHKILEISEYLFEWLYSCLMDNTYSSSNLTELRSILKRQKTLYNSFSNYDDFMLNFKDIYLLVDLSGNYEVIKSYFNNFKEILFTLIVKSGMKSGVINYDTDISVFQIKNAKIPFATDIKDVEMLNCKVSGIIENCHVYSSEFISAQLINTRILKNNIVEKSKIIKSPIHAGNTIKHSYIDNNNDLIAGTLDTCIIRSGIISELAKIDDDTIDVKKAIEKNKIKKPKQFDPKTQKYPKHLNKKFKNL